MAMNWFHKLFAKKKIVDLIFCIPIENFSFIHECSKEDMNRELLYQVNAIYFSKFILSGVKFSSSIAE